MNAHEIGKHKIQWSADLDEIFDPVLGPDLAVIRAEVRAGVSEVFYFPGHGHAITRIENYEAARGEFVLVAAAGRDVGALLPAFVDYARAAGLAGIRWHCDRPGVYRLAERLGFIERSREYFYRVD